MIHRFTIDEATEPPGDVGVHGFNLDGRHSSAIAERQLPLDCNHGDHFSILDPDQNAGTCRDGNVGGGPGCEGGVDNQLPHVVQVLRQFQPTFDFQRTLDDEMRRGRGLMILRVSGVDGDLGPALNDPAVQVSVYPFVVPTFADCADIARPRQSYSVVDRSLYTPGDLSSARAQFLGSIVDGRLRVAPTVITATTRFPLSLPHSNGPVALGLHDTRLRLTLGDAGATAGNLGGYASQDDLSDALLALLMAHMHPPDAARPLVQGFTDVATGATPPSCNYPRGGVGVGLGFDAVAAVVSPTTVPDAVLGVCGSAP